MEWPPDRLGSILARIEAGEDVTQAELDRIARMQTLDIARLGRQFITEALQRDTELTEVLRDG